MKNNHRNSNGWKFIKRLTKTKRVFRYENKSRLTGQSEPEKDWCTGRDRRGNEHRSSTRQSENFVFSDTQRKMWVEWKIISEQRDDDELNYFIINSVLKSHLRLKDVWISEYVNYCLNKMFYYWSLTNLVSGKY